MGIKEVSFQTASSHQQAVLLHSKAGTLGFIPKPLSDSRMIVQRHSDDEADRAKQKEPVSCLIV